MRGLRLLVVDDNASARDILCGMANSFGLNASAADSGAAALRMVTEADQRGQGFELVLLDWRMPVMDGIELAQRCADISPATKVMFITGFAAVTLKANREAPQARVLSKPFHLKDLVLEVERVFEDAAFTGTRQP